MLKIENLSKFYGDYLALDSLSIEVEKGSICGFVGPNGAGKTTLFRIIATLLKTTTGKVYVDDIDIEKKPDLVRNMVGYMPDFFGVYDDLKVEEYLTFYAELNQVSSIEIAHKIEDLLDLVGLSDKRYVYVDALSRGMKQRLCLARALMHDPKILILDEPASGMDPRARVHMKNILKELKKREKTILISSHILPEISEICDQIIVLEKGKVVVEDTVANIINKGTERNTVVIKALDRSDALRKLLHTLSIVEDFEQEDNVFRVHVKGPVESQAYLVTHIVQSGIPIYHFASEVEDLEDIFMKITKGEEYD